MKINYKKLNGNAIEPTRGSDYSAGLDLYAAYGTILYPGETIKVGTGIAVELPPGTFGAVYARSGIASKRGLRPANCVGVIDSDYRGEIIVALHNDSQRIQTIECGERIAQLVVQPYIEVEMEQADELSSTARGEGGFGSTGKTRSDSDTYSTISCAEYASYGVQAVWDGSVYNYKQMTFDDLLNEKSTEK